MSTLAPAEEARHHGLSVMGVRPSLPAYLRSTWTRRHFVWALARARTDAANTETRLGQLWQVLNPLLNAAVYFFVFGLLLQTSRNVPNFTAFLVIGVFIFTYTNKSVVSGSRAVVGNLGLIRAMHFPRSCLPLSTTLQELFQLGVSMAVMVVIVLATREAPTFAWLLLLPALVLQTLFNAGLAMVVARLTSRVVDFGQLLPFAMRTWLYLSGVFYPMQAFTERFPHWFRLLLDANPAAMFIELVRDAMLGSYESQPWAWPVAAGWAVVAFGVGLVYFWRGEETYGRG